MYHMYCEVPCDFHTYLFRVLILNLKKNWVHIPSLNHCCNFQHLQKKMLHSMSQHEDQRFIVYCLQFRWGPGIVDSGVASVLLRLLMEISSSCFWVGLMLLYCPKLKCVLSSKSLKCFPHYKWLILYTRSVGGNNGPRLFTADKNKRRRRRQGCAKKLRSFHFFIANDGGECFDGFLGLNELCFCGVTPRCRIYRRCALCNKIRDTNLVWLTRKGSEILLLLWLS